MSKSYEDILFDYLRDILFFPEKATLDGSALPSQYRKLGEGLTYLLDCILESRGFVRALAKGNLSVEPPSVENPIAGPAKELQGSLKHIAWQTVRVAEGDYKQRIDFMGEFSASFNIMIEQLAERTQKLEQAKLLAEEKNRELSQAQDLLVVLMENIPEYIMLFDLQTNSEYVVNRAAQTLKKAEPAIFEEIETRLCHHAQTYSRVNSRWDMSFPVENPDQECSKDNHRYYSVDSYPVHWGGRSAIAHIVRDHTAETTKEMQLMYDAMNDPLTGLFNRRYAMERLERWHKDGVSFCISMLDVDHLKYCNDMLGHDIGDYYLFEISQLLTELPGENTLCRIGGDEFLVISNETAKDVQNSRLEALRTGLMKGKLVKTLRFTPSFSYGSAANDPPGGRALGDILREADVEMYRYKRQNKPSLPEQANYKDTRL